jgi:lipoyl-dependent peroxiredoxin subunit D
VAAASAIACRNPLLRDALVREARERAGEAVVEDARAAAILMGMNNVYYRFRHIVGKPGYAQRPARLRMQRIAQPLTSKADFELFCLAVSAINACEACVRAHEHTVVESGLSEEQVHDAVRIASVVHAAAVALES